MFVTLEGNWISVRTHPEKASFPTRSTRSLNVTLARDSQFWNVPASISVTISGTVKERRLVQFANAPLKVLLSPEKYSLQTFLY